MTGHAGLLPGYAGWLAGLPVLACWTAAPIGLLAGCLAAFAGCLFLLALLFRWLGFLTWLGSWRELLACWLTGCSC